MSVSAIRARVPERLEIDHREEWHKVKETRLGNLDPLCKHEHWLKTHEGWALVEGTGKRPFVPPDDPRHPKNKPKDAREEAA